MEPFRDNEDLAATLGSLRPTPRPTFAAELDERAAAGFPRRPRPGASPFAGSIARLRAISPRRLLMPAGATALAAIAAATVVVAISEPKGTPSVEQHVAAKPMDDFGTEPQSQGKEEAGVESGGYVPGLEGSSSAGGAGAGTIPAEKSSSSQPNTGPYAADSGRRDVERSAEMVLGADPADVGKDAARVFEAVHANHGIVLSSSISDGEAGEAGAEFELLIPGARLSDALAAFSGIAEVRSRHEATADITAPTVSAGEHLRDSRARIEGLLDQLAAADTDAERLAAEAELRAERRHAAALRSELSTLQRRANLSRVSLRIETGEASASGDDEADSSWGVGDALADAGHILGIAAGVAIVGLAVIAPLALIALFVWLANRGRVRRHREHALD